MIFSSYKILNVCACLAVVLADQTPPPKCEPGQVIGGGVSEADEKLIVDLHNNVRKMITKGDVPGQPIGKDMEYMQYDATLAKKAKVISDTCYDDHIDIVDDRYPVGQNIYSSWSHKANCTPNWEEAVSVWFLEHRDYIYPCQKKRSSPVGHYTQVVWSSTTDVGCDFTCYRNILEPQKVMKLYTCNYGPGGNIVGVRPYNKA